MRRPTLDRWSRSTFGATGDLRSAALKMERRLPSSAGDGEWLGGMRGQYGSRAGPSHTQLPHVTVPHSAQPQPAALPSRNKLVRLPGSGM